MKRNHILAALAFAAVVTGAFAQRSQTNIKGNTEINVRTENTTAVAVGENNVAKNRIGVIQGDKKGDTKISVSATNVTNVVAGRNKKACVNIGAIVKDECK
jgi:hypothetical protein